MAYRRFGPLMLLHWFSTSHLAYSNLPNGDGITVEWQVHRFMFDGQSLTEASVEYWWNSVSPKILQLEISELSVCEQVIAAVEQQVLTPMEMLQLGLEGEKHVESLESAGLTGSGSWSSTVSSTSFLTAYDLYLHGGNPVFQKLESSQYLVPGLSF